MTEPEKSEFVKILVATFEVFNAKLTDAALQIWVNVVDEYPIAEVRKALSDYVKTPGNKFSPKPADLIEIIGNHDGRPGAEEAWATCPMSESESAYWTEETAQAYAAAAVEMLDRGDKIGARMAFREAYTKRVAEARANKIPVTWSFSPGHDKHGREVTLTHAISLGRVSLTRAKMLLPQIEYHSAPRTALEQTR
jgi:hypothetical protein